MAELARYLLAEQNSSADRSIRSIYDEVNQDRLNVAKQPHDRELDQHAYEHCKAFDSLFAKIDSNADGFISLAELNGVIKSKTLKTHEVHLAMGMRQCFEQLTALYPDAQTKQISKHDLATLVKRERYASEVWDPFIYEFARASLPVTDQTGSKIPLFVDKTNPLNSIVPEACEQQTKAGGNCILVASMGSLARGDKQAIRNMFTDNGNDTYTVVFPGFPDSPVVVPAPTADEVSYSIAARYGTWPFVLEKAFGRLCDADAREDYTGGREGIRFAYALRALNKGALAREDAFSSTSYAKQSDRINDALRRGVPIMATTPGNDSKVRTPIYRLPENHAYAVINFAANANDPKKSVVTLQNPWLHVAGSNVTDLGSGQFSLTLEEINKDFEGYVYGLRPPMRRTIYSNWSGCSDRVTDVLEPVLLGTGGAVTLIAAGALRRTGAAVLTPLAAYETFQDGRAFFNSTNDDDRLKYGLATLADGVMLAGVVSRFCPGSRYYGLAAAGAGLASRWAIERFL
jgi:hypothetical protein